MWAIAKAKEKAYISRINSEAREMVMAEAKAILREKTNAVKRSESEAGSRIRSKVEVEISKREGRV